MPVRQHLAADHAGGGHAHHLGRGGGRGVSRGGSGDGGGGGGGDGGKQCRGHCGIWSGNERIHNTHSTFFS